MRLRCGFRRRRRRRRRRSKKKSDFKNRDPHKISLMPGFDTTDRQIHL
jgi:hypothetical protein